MFLYRSRKSGTAKHKHSHKKKSLRQAPSSTYFYGGPQGHNTYSMYPSYDMNRGMTPRNHHSTDGEHKPVAQGNNIYYMYKSYDRNRNIGHKNPHSTDRDHKPIAHRQGGMPNHKSAYNSYYTVYPTMSYPENPQGYRSSRFLTYEYQMNEQWHSPAPSGGVHLARYHPSGRFDNDYRSEEYADSWDMY